MNKLIRVLLPSIEKEHLFYFNPYDLFTADTTMMWKRKELARRCLILLDIFTDADLLLELTDL